MSDSGALSLSDFVLKTPFSDISATADVDLSLLDKNPDAQLRLLAQAYLSCRDIAYIYPDIARYYIHSNRDQALLPISDVIMASIDIDGIARDLVVDKFNLSQMGVFSLDSRAQVSYPLDSRKRNMALSASFKTAGGFSLSNYMPDSIMEQRVVSHPIGAKLKAHLTGSDVAADVALQCMGGAVDVDVAYNLDTEQYSLNGKAHQVAMDAFMPQSSIGSLTAQMEVNGVHFSPQNPATSINAHVCIDTLEYQQYTYRNLDVVAQMAEQQWALTATSDAKELDVKIEAYGK